MLFELFLGSGLSLTAAHLYRYSKRRRRPQASGVGKAACLLAGLPHMASSQVLSQLDSPVAQELTQVMALMGDLPPEFLRTLRRQTLTEVFREVPPSRTDPRQAWLALAIADPALAADICRHLCGSELDSPPLAQTRL